MRVERLSPLDASFLAVETPIAHMHVGWAARFEPEPGFARPAFAELFAHIASRLERAPRLRRRLAPVPFGINAPEWVEDPTFDPWEHILLSSATRLSDLADAVMSAPLPRERPLWQLWIADRLDDGSVGVVGKAHHCMVDGVAAVELGSLLLDLEPVAGGLPSPPGGPEPARAPSALALLRRGLEDRARDALRMSASAASLARDPRRVAEAPAAAERVLRTVGHAAFPAAPQTALNREGSPERHLATTTWPLADLKAVKQRWPGTTINDVLLAACAGALRRHALRRGDPPGPLKAMVPVDVRAASGDDALGNRISFMFVELPCQEPDPVLRLLAVHRTTAERKRLGEPQDADGVLRAIGHAPQPVQHVAARIVAAPRMYNLVVSNIPGFPVPVFLRGCRLRSAFPVVPLAERHALSIGMTTVAGRACFGLYADRATLPDADELARDLDAALEDLAVARPTAPWPERPPRTGQPPSAGAAPVGSGAARRS
jgi:diacylglycerol O-acyltransferase / wax synthase